MNKFFKYLLIILALQANMAVVRAADELPKNKDDWRGLLQLARKAYHDKDYQKSLLFYETALPVLPKNVDVSEEIAQTRYRLKQYDAATDIYTKKSKTNKPTKARSFHNLGNISMEKKEYKKAIEHYKNALRNDPTNERTRYNLSEAIRKLKEEEKKNPPPKNDKDDQNKNKPEKPQDNKNNENQNNPSALNDQSVQRELEKLMKKEAATKRKLANGKGTKSGIKTQKDW